MGSIIGGAIGAFGQMSAAKEQAKAARYAADKALTGYNYLTKGPGADAIQPYIESGTNANSMMAALLGVPSGGAAGGSTSGGTGGQTFASGPLTFVGGGGAPGAAAGAAGTAGAGGGVTVDAANNAFNNYLNSTGYQFQLGQGMDAINSNAAASGLLNSGGTLKALTKYGQGLGAQSFNNYLSQLGGLSESGRGAIGQVASAGAAGGGGAANAIMQGANASAAGTVAGFNALGNAVGQGINFLSNRGGQSRGGFPPAPGGGLY